jgi:hypothetical protein
MCDHTNVKMFIPIILILICSKKKIIPSVIQAMKGWKPLPRLQEFQLLALCAHRESDQTPQ